MSVRRHAHFCVTAVCLLHPAIQTHCLKKQKQLYPLREPKLRKQKVWKQKRLFPRNREPEHTKAGKLPGFLCNE